MTISIFPKKQIGNIMLGFGPLVQQFEEEFSKYSGKKYNIGMNSASSCAYSIFFYLKEKYGTCDVYIPSLSFVSPTWAAKIVGHNVIFVDCNDKLVFGTLSYEDIRKERCNDNKIIILMLMYGGISLFPGFIEHLRGDEIVVVDAAHCLNINMVSDFIFYSFYPTKPVVMSVGGLIGINDKYAADYLLRFRNFGRVPVKDSYDIVQDGSKFYMDNLNASIGLNSLKTVKTRINKRKQHFLYLEQHINPKLGTMVMHDKQSAYTLCTLVLNHTYSSRHMRSFLRNKGIESSFHYPLLHRTSAMITNRYKLPYCESICDRIINLPIHEELTKEDITNIAQTVNEYS